MLHSTISDASAFQPSISVASDIPEFAARTTLFCLDNIFKSFCSPQTEWKRTSYALNYELIKCNEINYSVQYYRDVS